MKLHRKNRGFTLAETLITLAIVSVLAGVAFLAIYNQQVSMSRLEYDAFAKEIFIAAQNHLTAAESQGYPDGINFGESGRIETDEETADVYFIVSSDADTSTIRSLMLPDYALEGMTMAGSYIIRYQPSPATILDVFYSQPGKSSLLTRAGKTLDAGDFPKLMGTATNYRAGGERNRQNYDGSIVGWYGGAEPVPKGERIKTPSFEIINAETLRVKVTDPNTVGIDGYRLKLVITGKLSNEETYYTLSPSAANARISGSSGMYTVVLDSVTDYDSFNGRTLHFSDINKEKLKNFIPGEDISVKLVAYSTTVLSNVAMTAEKTANSLFADGSTTGVAQIANFRHLENLDWAVSNLDDNDSSYKLNIVQAKQTEDLNWTDFLKATHTGDDPSALSVVYFTGKTTSTGDDGTPSVQYTGDSTKAGCYYPISPDYALIYDGQGNSVINLNIDYPGDAGMFGTLDKKTGDVEIQNVAVRNEGTDTALVVKGSGSTGGLVGSMTGGKVTNCATAVYVDGATAGGLIGMSNGVTVKGCYSGGHTSDGAYLPETRGSGTDIAAPVNVTGSTAAGGLIGSLAGGSVASSYSTCSVYGATAGGFVGSANGGAITGCYCTGLVLGNTKYAFLGYSQTANTTADNWYYATVNDRYYASQMLLGLGDLEALPPGPTPEGETVPPVAYPFDKDHLKADGTVTTAYEAYMSFFPDNYLTESDSEGEKISDAAKATPYDSWLKNQYKSIGGKGYEYAFPTVSQLLAKADTHLASDNAGYKIVSVHYGDWPAMETRVINPAS